MDLVAVTSELQAFKHLLVVFTVGKEESKIKTLKKAREFLQLLAIVSVRCSCVGIRKDVRMTGV